MVIPGFNPRAREGATRLPEHFGTQDKVSIHAPVRARRDPKLCALLILGFNPRAREGATLVLLRWIRVARFQSTRP